MVTIILAPFFLLLKCPSELKRVVDITLIFYAEAVSTSGNAKDLAIGVTTTVSLIVIILTVIIIICATFHHVRHKQQRVHLINAAGNQERAMLISDSDSVTSLPEIPLETASTDSQATADPDRKTSIPHDGTDIEELTYVPLAANIFDMSGVHSRPTTQNNPVTDNSDGEHGQTTLRPLKATTMYDPAPISLGSELHSPLSDSSEGMLDTDDRLVFNEMH